eukprot:12729280-Alexandrium_andersonii.AAC.1
MPWPPGFEIHTATESFTAIECADSVLSEDRESLCCERNNELQQHPRDTSPSRATEPEDAKLRARLRAAAASGTP